MAASRYSVFHTVLLHLAVGPKQCPTHGANTLPRTLFFFLKSELGHTFVVCLIIWIDRSNKTFPPLSFPSVVCMLYHVTPLLAEMSNNCPSVVDASFGPWAGSSCRGGFDFTQFFEQSILTIVPVSVFLLASPFRLYDLAQRKPVTLNNPVRVLKLVRYK